MVLLHCHCCSGTITHRLVNATTGAFIFSKDHGDTVRAVCPGASSVYYVGGNRNNNISSTYSTTRQIDSSGNQNWAKDHGATVWALKALAGGDVWSAGATSSSITHRKYDSSGTQLLAINATPFGGGVNVDPASGRIWAYKSTGGTDPDALERCFAYDSDGDYTGNLTDSTITHVDHDDAGNVYTREGTLSITIRKFTAGVQQWSKALTVVSGTNTGFAVDRATGDTYVSSSLRIRKVDTNGSEVTLGSASNGPSSPTTLAVLGSYVYSNNGVGISRYDKSTGAFDGGWSYASAEPGLTQFLEPCPSETAIYIARTSAVLEKVDVSGAGVQEWSDSTLSSTLHVSANDTYVAVCGGGTSENVAVYDHSGSLQWSDAVGNPTTSGGPQTVNSVSLTDAALYFAGGGVSFGKCDSASGAAEWVRFPSRTVQPTDISVSGDEVVTCYSSIAYGAKIYESDGTLIDFWGPVVTAVEFDGAGKLFIGTSSDVIRIDDSTYIRDWRAAFGTVDLAIASTGKVLTGTGTLLRQLTSAGASDWSKNVGGTITSVAYDASNNAWVAHSRSSSISHRKYDSTGTSLLTGDHGAGLNSIRCDSSSRPIVGGARI